MEHVRCPGLLFSPHQCERHNYELQWLGNVRDQCGDLNVVTSAAATTSSAAATTSTAATSASASAAAAAASAAATTGATTSAAASAAASAKCFRQWQHDLRQPARLSDDIRRHMDLRRDV
jgi:hypothetical protein